MRLLSILLTFCGVVSAQDASLEGITVSAVTGMPMPGVHVKVFTGTFTMGFDGTEHRVYGAKSDRAGHFSISQVVPGSYFYLGEATGFVTMRKESGNFPFPGLVLKPGDHVNALRVELTPEAVLSGRVLDEFGDPVQGFFVQASRVSIDDPAGYTPSGGRAVTNDRGEFRIPTGPGKYYLKATARQGAYERPEVRKDNSTAATYAPTYFPSAASTERATAVDAGPGATVTGIEIRLASQHAFTISGTVSGLPPGSQCQINMRYGESAIALNEFKSLYCGPDGHFSFPGIHAPVVILFGSASGGVRLQTLTTEVKPNDADVANIDIPLVAGVEVSGVLVGDTGERRTVTLQPAGIHRYMTPGVSADSAKEGVFHIPNVFPGKYTVKVHPLSPNSYVADLRLDETPVPNDELDFTHINPASKLKIAIGKDGGEVSGAVLDKDGQRVIDSDAAVFLFQGSITAFNASPAQVSKQGTFSIDGIRPGKYKIFAVDAMRSGALDGEKSLNRLMAEAEEIEVGPSARITKDLKVAHGK